MRWVYTGFKLFGADVRTSFYLTKRVIKGYPLSVRERRLLVRSSESSKKQTSRVVLVLLIFQDDQ